MIRTLHVDEFFRVEFEPRDGVVKVTRSDRVLPTPEVETSVLGKVAASVDQTPRPRVLLDLRAAPAGDGESEGLQLTSAFSVRPERVAVLVSDPRGAKSAWASSALPTQLFGDEDSAFEWLLR